LGLFLGLMFYKDIAPLALRNRSSRRRRPRCWCWCIEDFDADGANYRECNSESVKVREIRVKAVWNELTPAKSAFDNLSAVM